MRKLFLILLIMLVSVGSVGAQSAQTALVRLLNLPMDTPAVTLNVDGEALAGSDGTPTVVSPVGVSLYQPVSAGQHSLSVTPDGDTISAALVESMDATLEAGHRYTLVLTGDAANLKNEWIDETAGYEAAGLDSDKTPTLLVNNLKNAPALDFSVNGKPLGLSIASGEHAFLSFDTGNYDSLDIIAADDPSTVLFTTPIFFEPATAYVVGLTGDASGGMDTFGAAYALVENGYSPRNAGDFLAGFSGLGIGFAAFPAEVELPFEKQTFSFDKAIAAFDAAGLASVLTGDDEHTLFIPTDDAFDALPAGTLDSLMADPEQLKNVLLYHVADGRMSFDDLVAQGSVTTLQGGDLTIAMTGDGALGINGTEAGCGCNYDVTNAHIFIVDHVLMPES